MVSVRPKSVASIASRCGKGKPARRSGYAPKSSSACRAPSLQRSTSHRGDPPSLARELRVLAGCVYHVFRYRCGNGILLAAHSTGRVREGLARS